MKFIITRSSSYDDEECGIPGLQLMRINGADHGLSRDQTRWTKELNSLEELLEFCEECFKGDDNRNPQLIVSPGYLGYPEIEIYDDWRE